MNHAKVTSSYWAERVYFHALVTGHETEYSVKIQHRCRRIRFNLRTNDRKFAGEIAAALYRTIITTGWDAAIASHKNLEYRPAEPDPPLTKEHFDWRINELHERLDKIEQLSKALLVFHLINL